MELFFKWIKQHLRIKAFYGTSQNAVKTQVWIATSVYVLVAILKKRLALQQSLYTILQVLSVTIFEKTPILQVFSDRPIADAVRLNHNQLSIFEIQPDSSVTVILEVQGIGRPRCKPWVASEQANRAVRCRYPMDTAACSVIATAKAMKITKTNLAV